METVRSSSGTLEDFIRDVPDFPKPGVKFKDLTPLLGNAEAFHAVIESFARICDEEDLAPTKVASPEARGFLFASALAQRLGLGLVPIRKPGKLPWRTIEEEYALEYGTDRVQMHEDAVTRGDRVLLLDDVLATGGTMNACTRLIASTGARIEGCLFVIELGIFEGRKRLDPTLVRSLVVC